MKLKKENKKGKVIHNIKRKDFHAKNFARVTERLGNGVTR
jgi:hypothetical protein